MESEDKKASYSMWISMAIALGISFYFLITDSGPYRYLADFQAENLFHGSYYPKYTFIIVFLLIWIPIGVVMTLIREKFFD